MMEICLWLGYSSVLDHVSFKTQIICLYGTASVEQEQATSETTRLIPSKSIKPMEVGCCYESHAPIRSTIIHVA